MEGAQIRKVKDAWSEGMYPKRELESTERTLVGFSRSKVACSVERGKIVSPNKVQPRPFMNLRARLLTTK